MNQEKKDERFNSEEERAGIKREAAEERREDPGAFTQTGNDLSLGDEERNAGNANGDVFGANSNATRFSGGGNNEGTGTGNPVPAGGD